MLEIQLKLTTAYGGPFIVPSGDQVIGASLQATGQFETDDIKLVQDYWFQHYGINLNDTFVDIGANIGTHTIAALRNYGFKNGVAIEPAISNFRLLKTNLALQDIDDRVKCFNCAATNKNGSDTLYHNFINCGDHRLGNMPLENATSENVQLVDTKTLLDQLLLNRVLTNSLCWIDTQGHEYQILSSISPLLCEGLPVVIEFWPFGLKAQGTSKSSFLDLLSSSNLQPLILSGHKLYPISFEDLSLLWDDLFACDTGFPDGARFVSLVLTRVGFEKVNFSDAEQKRVRLTSSCTDCDQILKVDSAGTTLTRYGKDYLVMHNGILVSKDDYYGPWMSQIISNLSGHHEPQEELVFDKICQLADQSGLIIELGCYWSYYSLWFVSQHPNRRGICLDPDKDHLNVGINNAKINSLSERLQFIEGICDPLGGRERLITTESGYRRRVQAFTLADLKKLTSQKIELLHCDAQGSESFVVDQAIELSRQGLIRFFVFSTHAYEITGNPLTHQEVLQKLISAGCHIIAEHDVFESFSGDGLIAGSFDDRDTGLTVKISYSRTSSSVFASPSMHHKLLLDKVSYKSSEASLNSVNLRKPGLFTCYPAQLKLILSKLFHGPQAHK